MDFHEIPLQKLFHVSSLYSLHYFEFSRTYTFPGEQHDFWELVYVDKGEVLATAGDREFALQSGELLLHAPNEWHNIRSNGTIAPNVMILSFRCRSKAMAAFTGKRMRPDSLQRELLRQLLQESRTVFASRLDDPYDHRLVKEQDIPAGAEQMILLHLTHLLISLYRQLEAPKPVDRKSGSLPLLDAMIAFMERNLTSKMTLQMLAEEFHVSTSYVKRLFAQYKQCGAIHYFTLMKVDHAKKLLREHDHNVSQIAEELGYDNIYYFCNQFKKIEGMSPLEYRRSVKAIGDRARLFR